MNLILRKSAKPAKRSVRNYQPTYSPFEGMLQLLNGYYPWTALTPTGYSTYSPNMNMVDYGDRYQIDIEVPGYDEENLEITVDGNQLTISGKRDSSTEEKSDRYIYQERSVGSFTRTVNLPEESLYDDISAHLSKGILQLEVPKSQKASAPKRVEIKNK